MQYGTIRQKLIRRIRQIAEQGSTGTFGFEVIRDEEGNLTGFRYRWQDGVGQSEEAEILQS